MRRKNRIRRQKLIVTIGKDNIVLVEISKNDLCGSTVTTFLWKRVILKNREQFNEPHFWLIGNRKMFLSTETNYSLLSISIPIWSVLFNIVRREFRKILF